MSVSRRTFLGGGLAAAAVAATGTPLLTACGASQNDVAAANRAVRLPTFTKYAGVTPDLPSDGVVLDGFLKYPANPVRAITEAPGNGRPITFLTNIPGAIPPAADRNQFWQALNERLGSELQISMASNDEYKDKFATRIAGGDLPDILNIPVDTAQIPGLVKAKCLDLSEHLSGDAVQKYPFLANIPTDFWKGCVFNGAIYGVPVPRGMSRTSLALYREDLLAAKGIKDPRPKNFEEFFDLAKELTAAKQNRWAWTRVPLSTIRQMLGVPNVWKENGGKFSSSYEDEANQEALESGRKMVAAGVVNPDAFNDKASARKQWFNGGIAAFDYDSFVAWNQYYADNTAGDAFAVNMLDVPGGTPWMGGALNNVTAFSKDSKHSPETLLKIANWMAAPFGTEEYLFRKYGVAGRHYTLQGTDPIPSKAGVVETGIGLQYISDAPLSLYWAGKPEVPRKQHAVQQKIAKQLVHDASYGLYSDTQSKKQAQLARTMTDLETQIIQGKKPVSDWARGVADWKAAGGDKMRSELEQALADTAGK
ncbi:extracellular solute-binding protein [Kribbella sandramycini]|uniref:Extracellular solute-binding protein n=1 Tax=Kribbella sandramycini TaxID=60450 RepID=A0A7Y4L2B8_9ACTN|nr:extracellular solute-binding protein [Kribbella sandramycini]MBB6564470.1 putative aldouronate transport system substrate-binding protein [Kribbella sandramycini]NOL42176.1 extracellular solute-binding protein [Kribbella sandramycini]